MAIVLGSAKKSAKRYPVAAIRDGVIFPHVEVVLTFGRPKSTRAVKESFATDRHIVFITQKKSSILDPKPEDLYAVGVLAKIERTLKTNEEINALVVGLQRVRIEKIHDTAGYLQAEISPIPDITENTPDIEALTKHLISEFKRAVNLGKSVEFLNFMKLMSGAVPSELADQIATTLELTTSKKQRLLEMAIVRDRMQAVLDFLNHEVKVLQIEKNIANKTQKKFDKSMRDAVLRERMRTIQKELGESDDEEQEVKEFRKKIKQSNMPKATEKKVLKELERFSRLNVHNPEHSYMRSWLEVVTDLPWSVMSDKTISIKNAFSVLNQDHYALEEVKERVLEYLAVLELKKKSKTSKDRRVPTILCFAGPPGVGKTSIGRSIAKALGREFAKISLGGIRDEAEIRGHRRTYVGAMPGRIIQSIRNVGKKNPVLMLDEIDKLGNDFRGDPSSALLEALDPEQNHEFSDHYLEIPFDLSEVIFITTANVLDTIPPALRDRLEIIRFSGYTLDEKFQIAKHHLMQKTREANGLTLKQVSVDTSALKSIIKQYTREAGVRNLEREIAKVMRKVAKQIASKTTAGVKVTSKNIPDLLGPAIFTDTLSEKSPKPGLATALAWTQAGGDIMFIEVALMPGSGKAVLTGKLGKVMQESARAAWTVVRTRYQSLKLKKDFYKEMDIHIHVPEGAVPKDGPSAGITMTTALVSALTNKPVKAGLGMTGEITLRGRVLEIGGVKEKVVAAHRSGLRELILPKNNQKDTVKIPPSVLKDIKIHYVDTIDQVLKIALSK